MGKYQRLKKEGRRNKLCKNSCFKNDIFTEN